VLNCKKNTTKKYYGSKSKGNKYILKKKDPKQKVSSTQLFVAILFMVYGYLLAISLSLRVFVFSSLNLFGSPIIFLF